MVSVKTSAQIWIRICTVQIWSDTDMFYTRADSVASIHIVLPRLYSVHKEYVSDFNNFKIFFIHLLIGVQTLQTDVKSNDFFATMFKKKLKFPRSNTKCEENKIIHEIFRIVCISFFPATFCVILRKLTECGV